MPRSIRIESFVALLSILLMIVLSAPVAARPPTGQPGVQPLIVLPAFVVRCDGTPDVAPFRVARPGYCVNEEGEAIADPAADPKEPAMEADPELRWEAFDEYWRKIHGPKIIHVDGLGDSATKLLLRYEQQHRIPGGPTSAFAPPYPPQVDSNGLLITDPHAHVAGYQRPSFDGLAQLAFATREDFNSFFGLNPGDKYLDKIVPDEKVFLKGFAFNISEEHIVIADRGARDPIILVKTLERGAQFASREEFQDRWLTEHARLVTTGATARKLVQRYAQLHNISVPSDAPFYDPAGDRFDVIEVFSFANPTELETFLASDRYAAIAADDAANTERTEIFTAVNYIIRIQHKPEKPTTVGRP